MARYVDTRNSMYSQDVQFTSGLTTPITRLDMDGQNGIVTDYRTLNSNVPYIRQNLLCFLLEAPHAFQYLPNPKYWVVALKTLFETRAERWEGLNASITAEYTTVPVGASEEQHVFVRTVREKSAPVGTWTDSYGMGISRFFETWITQLMQDPLTKVPGLITLRGNTPNFRNKNRAYEAYVLSPENISATAIFIEPDPTHTHVVKAFLCTNMMPQSAGEKVGSRNLQEAPDKSEVSVTFTCLQEVNRGVDLLAANILNTLNLEGLNSFDRRAYLGDDYSDNDKTTAIHSDVFGAKSDGTIMQANGDRLNKGSDGKVGYVNQANATAKSENYDQQKAALGFVGDGPGTSLPVSAIEADSRLPAGGPPKVTN